MTADNQNYGIYFSGEENPFDIISRILGKNNIKEAPEEEFKKIENDEELFSGILYILTVNFVLGKITEKDFVLSIQKQLGINPEVAESLNKDIKLMLLPLAVKEKIGSQKTEEESVVTPKIKAPIEVEKILQQRQAEMLKEKIKGAPATPAVEEVARPAPRKKFPFPAKETSEKPVARQPKKSDSYREPVE